MTRLLTILTEGFADWETTMLNAVAHGFYRAETAYASPEGRPVTSMGGLQVTPGFALEQVDVTAFDALVVCGGTAWRGPNPPDIAGIVTTAHRAGRVVAGICDGTWALARTGLLDGVGHTSNGAGYLDDTGYVGKPNYRDEPGAVTDQRVITAPATAPVAFMAAVLAAIGLADDQLHYYIGLHARQFGGLARAA